MDNPESTNGPLTTPSPVSNLPTEESPARKRPVLVMIVAIILIILIALGVAVAYPYFFGQSPQKVLAKMSDKMSDINQVSYDLSLDANMKGTDSGQFSFSVKGSSDDIGKKHTMDVSASIKSEQLQKQGLGNISLDGSIRFIDDKAYVMLDRAPSLGFISLSFLEGQWIEIDQTSGQSIAPGLDLKKLEDGAPNPEEVEGLKQLLMQKEVIKVTKVGSETIDGIDTHRYGFTIDKAALMEVVSMIEASSDGAGSNDIGKDLESLKSASGEIWIGKNDDLLYGLNISVEIEDETSSGAIDLKLKLRDYGKKVEVTKPSSTTTIEKAMENLFGGMMMGADSSAGSSFSL